MLRKGNWMNRNVKRSHKVIKIKEGCFLDCQDASMTQQTGTSPHTNNFDDAMT